MRLLESCTNQMLFIYSFGWAMILHIVVCKFKPQDYSSSAVRNNLTVTHDYLLVHRSETSALVTDNPVNLRQHVSDSVYSDETYI